MMPSPDGMSLPERNFDQSDNDDDDEENSSDQKGYRNEDVEDVSPELAMLHDKQDILRKYGNVSAALDIKSKKDNGTPTIPLSQPKQLTLPTKGTKNDSTTQKNKKKNVAGNVDEKDIGVPKSLDGRENSFVPNPRNIGNIAGMLSHIDYNFMRGDDDDLDSDEDGSSSDDNNGHEDFRVVSMFAKRIYDQNEEEKNRKTDKFLQTMKEDAISVNRRDMPDDNDVGKENTFNANKGMEGVDQIVEKAKDEWENMLTHIDTQTAAPTLREASASTPTSAPMSSSIDAFLPPASAPPHSAVEPAILANESALLEAEEIQKAIDEVNKNSSNSSEHHQSPPSDTYPSRDKDTDKQANQRYHPSEMRHRLLVELRRQEDLFSYAIELAELEKVYTQQSAHEIVDNIRQKADEEIRKERAQSESMLQQQAYELAVANAMASAQLALEKEALAANKTVDDLKLQLQQQGIVKCFYMNTFYLHFCFLCQSLDPIDSLQKISM